MDPRDRSAPTIESVHNPRIKAALRLRERGERDERGLTIVDGFREVERAIRAGAVVEEAFVADGAGRGGDLVGDAERGRALELAARTALRLSPVSPAVLERLAFGSRAEGIVAVVRTPPTSLEALDARLRDVPAPLLVVLDGVEKPGNLGAIVRSADGAGADAVIAAGAATDVYNPNAIRASIGTIFALAPAAAPPDEVVSWLAVRGLRIVAARVDAVRIYTEADLRGPLAIVVGSEAEGLGTAWSSAAVEPVRLPMLGLADSLNVSVAAAVLLYEARRQRGLS